MLLKKSNVNQINIFGKRTTKNPVYFYLICFTARSEDHLRYCQRSVFYLFFSANFKIILFFFTQNTILFFTVIAFMLMLY